MYFNKFKQEPIAKITNKNCITNYTTKTKSKSQIQQIKNRTNTTNQFNNTDLLFNISLNNSNQYQSFSNDENKQYEGTKDLQKIIGTQSPVQKKENLTEKSDYRNNINDKLLFTLKTLDLENLLNEFNMNYITFKDIFFLSRDDLIEMKIPIGPRNRILYFAEEYKKNAVNYDFNELIDFFQNHKEFIINNHYNFKIYYNNNNIRDNNMIEEPPIPMSKPYQILFNNINNKKDFDNNNFCDNISFVNCNNSNNQNNVNNNFRCDILNSPKTNSSKKFIKDKKNDIPVPIKVNNNQLSNNCNNENFIRKGSYRQKSSSLVNKEFKLNDIEIYNDEENENNLIYDSILDSNKKNNSIARNNTTSAKNDTNNKYNNKSNNYSKQSTMNRSNSYSVQSNSSMNNKNKVTSQVLKNYENIFSEIENFQSQYEKMKEKSEERNNKINSLLHRRNIHEIEKIKKQLMVNNNYKNNNKINKLNNNNIENMIFINEKDLLNESERNLNDELGKVYHIKDNIK